MENYRATQRKYFENTNNVELKKKINYFQKRQDFLSNQKIVMALSQKTV